MLSIFEYKKNYLSEQLFYQFIRLNEELNIVDSCQSIFEMPLGDNLIRYFPFLESIKEAIHTEKTIFLPRIDISETENESKIYDFLLFREERFPEKPIICIIKDVSRSEKSMLETEQMARLAMLENEYLNLQNKNIQLENTILQMRNEELRKSRDLKNLFFSKISHELRSPVNGILGLSQIILEQENPTGELKEYIESIYTASKHLRTILDDILDLSKLESGSIRLQKQHFHLNTIFQHLQLNFLQVLEKKHLKLHFEIDEQVPHTLVGDEVRLTQVFYNLISNAIKFTENGGVNVKVQLRDLNEHEKKCILSFEVSDTGIGMTEQELQRIFDPYEQVGTLSFHELGGTGLGLSVVKQLIEIFGGKISVSSQKNVGTTFFFEIPFEFLPQQETPQTYQKYQFFALKALLVDDSPISRLYTQKILLQLGFEVEVCGESKKALELLQNQYYDLLITDLQMPDLEGDEVVRIFEKNNPHQRPTAVLFATGSLGLRKVNHPVLLKPFSQEQMLYMLEQVIPQEKRTLCSMNYLHKITDGQKEFLQEMLDSLMMSIPEDITRVGEFLTQKDQHNLHKAVHKLKPSTTLIGSEVLSRIASEMEKMTLQNPPNWEKLQKYYDVMQNLVNSCSDSMKKMLQT
ncbi:MAG: ATP-binding protein [Raineya sp.]|nr:ATP-binding protein [Raineya sp.]MDW8297460.1 ATP-binding protein [Raineya sp.]